MDTRLTLEQFGQLMNLLNKQNNNEENKVQATANSAHLAGKKYFNAYNVHNWVIDSGASDHICFQFDLFQDYKKVEGKTHFVAIPNGKQVKVDIIGYVFFCLMK